MARAHRRLAALAPLLLLATVGGASAVPSAAAEARAEAGTNRAVVVVDTGEGSPRRACIVFDEPSITGLDALRTAQMDPVVQGYAGEGGAVCKLCGIGCDAGSQCLTCQSPKYWQYWRAVSGSSAFTYSNTGAGSTEVRDGDVEGWRWSGTKGAPPYYSVDTVCADASRTFRYEPDHSASTTSEAPRAPAATSTTSTTSASTAGVPTTAQAAAPSGARAVTTTAAPAAGAATTLLSAPSTTEATIEAETDVAPAGDSGDVAAASPRGTRDTSPVSTSSPVPGLVGFAVVLAAILGLIVRARRS